MFYLLRELAYVPGTHQPQSSLALNSVSVMIQGPKNVNGTDWFVVGCLRS